MNMNEMMMSQESGSETTDLHKSLLLSGPSREMIRMKLVEMAEYYIDKVKNDYR